MLGEEGAVGGTARYVDSSLERLQVKVDGPGRASRYAVTCNGRAVPLAADRHARRVGGRRALPRLAAAGLPAPDDRRRTRRCVFDLVDRWNGRSLGGCTYHVTHPAGRNYETLPVNALEAEGRRLARFEAAGPHAGADRSEPTPTSNPEFPHTLDLRRFG